MATGHTRIDTHTFFLVLGLARRGTPHFCRSFCINYMNKVFRKEDLEFLNWLNSEENEQYWTKNDKGEKDYISLDNWCKARKERNKKKLFDNKNIFSHVELWGLEKN